MSAEVFTHGFRQVMARIEKRQAEIERDKERAARSAANVFRRYIRAEAKQIRGKGIVVLGVSKRTGRATHSTRHLLERRVDLSRQFSAGGSTGPKLTGFEVRETAPHAHLVIRGHQMWSHGIGGRHGRGSGRPLGTFTHPNPFVHRAFLAAGREPLIAARVVLLEGGPEVPDA